MIETIQIPKDISPSELIYQDHVRHIYRRVANFEGFSKQYLVSDTGERAALLVIYGSYILLVRQYRLLINGISLEIPGGKVDEGETPKKTAIRECHEETGIKCKKLKFLQNYYPGLDVTYNPTYIFYSNDPIKKSIITNERSLWLSLDTCLEMIFTGKIQDAMTIIAILTYFIKFRIDRNRNLISDSEVHPDCVLQKK